MHNFNKTVVSLIFSNKTQTILHFTLGRVYIYSEGFQPSDTRTNVQSSQLNTEEEWSKR